MAKVHEFLLRSRYSEIDGMKYVHNSKYLVYFEEARVDLVRQNGYAYDDIEKDGLMFPVSEAKVLFKKPVFYNELVTIEVTVEYLKTFSVRFNYKIIKEDKSTASEGYTVHACVDIKSGDFTEISDRLVNILKPYQKSCRERCKERS